MKKIIFAFAVLVGLQTAATAQNQLPATKSAQAANPTNATTKHATASPKKGNMDAKNASHTAQTANSGSAAQPTNATTKQATGASKTSASTTMHNTNSVKSSKQSGGATAMPAKAAPKK